MVSKFLKDDNYNPKISSNLLQSFFNNIPVAIIIYNVINNGATSYDYIIASANPKAIETEKWNRTEIIGQPLGLLRPGVEEFGIIEIFKSVWETGETFYYPAKVYEDNNEYRWFENTIFKLPTGEVVAVYEDVTDSKIKEEKIEYLSYRDSLTGLYNRAYFEESIKELDTEASLPLTIVMADLNGLKLINDVFGHQVGDEALIKISNCFETNLRDSDIVFRIGGDEFVILLPNSDKDIGQIICDRITGACAKAQVADTKLSLSIGYATKKHMSEKWQDILKTAEDNMYKAKLLGAESYRSVILSSMKKTLFEKSSETEEHGERLEHFCVKIGARLGLSSSELNDLKLFSMLHDIGKIGIDSSILDKPGPLTDSEWSLMKTHTEIGYRIAKSVPDLVDIADYILCHHERWDGKGYPGGLKEEEIPLLSRILSVVDAFDAMTNNRPYRKSLSYDFARSEIIKNSGSQFDPDIVNIFLDILDKDKKRT